ncbi:NADH dehydrogenase [ubiquinone] 1 beta subcomplex subunit 7 [Venturia canescens]|uniref:NADH dehydrogenase [ubiquinone] 1 beta subcomplex subunit 7 n=1 Tax=Venturia canescens TaxID=32260 RepID=UPI001C9C10F9|nr:NADH dehydrogenase [ubiquinone] 1 beta subcomplex subunit 7 [Venturia canescens]
MGNVFAGEKEEFKTKPEYNGTPQFDPLDGFPNGRKKRVMLATEEEMIAVKLPLSERDYCAHLAIKIEDCRYRNYPWVARCKADVHAWNDCQYEDFVLRMKEYERERRLLERQKRKLQAAAA